MSLVHANIGSDLRCKGATFMEADHKALVATSAQISGSVLIEETVARGKTRFDSAKIRGNFRVHRCEFQSLDLLT